MIQFFEMRENLRAVWPDTTDKVRTIAARYYIGAETDADLDHMLRPQPYYIDKRGREHVAPPVLTLDEVHLIKSRR